jgi:hypothetical protein
MSLGSLSQIKQGEEVMPQYLVAMYLPDDYDPSVETEETIEGSTRSTAKWRLPAP